MTAFAQQHQLPVVALDPVDYVQAKDYFAVSVLRAIDRANRSNSPNRYKVSKAVTTYGRPTP
ncbi:hypothetical protein TUA1478L_29130 [Lactiplantibacillus plantarum]